jgi:hypothetical protein
MNGTETIKDFCYPLESIDQVFILVYLNSESNWSYQSEFITETFNSIFSTKYELRLLKVAIAKFSRFVNVKEKLSILKKRLQFQHEIIPIPLENCIYCHERLVCEIEANTVLVFSVHGSFNKKLEKGVCVSCKTKYHCDFFEIDGTRFLYKNDIEIKFLITSTKTAFEISFLEWFDINLVRNITSFSGFAEAYNEFYFSKINKDTVNIFKSHVLVNDLICLNFSHEN